MNSLKPPEPRDNTGTDGKSESDSNLKLVPGVGRLVTQRRRYKRRQAFTLLERGGFRQYDPPTTESSLSAPSPPQFLQPLLPEPDVKFNFVSGLRGVSSTGQKRPHGRRQEYLPAEKGFLQYVPPKPSLSALPQPLVSDAPPPLPTESPTPSLFSKSPQSPPSPGLNELTAIVVPSDGGAADEKNSVGARLQPPARQWNSQNNVDLDELWGLIQWPTHY